MSIKPSKVKEFIDISIDFNKTVSGVAYLDKWVMDSALTQGFITQDEIDDYIQNGDIKLEGDFYHI